MSPTHYRLHRFRQLATEAQRRRRISLWLERFENLERTPARSDTERTAKAKALELMRAAYPR